MFKKMSDAIAFAKEKKFDFTGMINNKFEELVVTDLRSNKKFNIKIEESIKFFKNEANN